jgi:hypothetical protein
LKLEYLKGFLSQSYTLLSEYYGVLFLEPYEHTDYQHRYRKHDQCNNRK